MREARSSARPSRLGPNLKAVATSRRTALVAFLVILIAGSSMMAGAQSLELLSGTRLIDFWRNSGPLDDPNLYTRLEVRGSIPAQPGATAGGTLVVSLRDADRPQQTCPSPSADSGCLVLDYSPILETEVTQFDLTVTVDLVIGRRTFFLWEDRTLRPNRGRVPL
jgi:hypothetical protein